MSKFKFTWGHGVMIGLFSFIAFILTLIFLADGQTGDIYDDYYEHSLKYQTETIDAVNNVKNLPETPTIKTQANGFLIHFPPSIKPSSGSICLIRGAHTKDDIKLDLNLRNNEQLIPAAIIEIGEYDLELRWFENNKSYLIKNRIEWKLP
ncbi:FixH family protein [Weeksellaceae bacterium TAE3-ERU29]|nr:FixH family protein [Weeksellaceae bacterium TAE3-ERU29]